MYVIIGKNTLRFLQFDINRNMKDAEDAANHQKKKKESETTIRYLTPVSLTPDYPQGTFLVVHW